jgi:hypothetical protein
VIDSTIGAISMRPTRSTSGSGTPTGNESWQR